MAQVGWLRAGVGTGTPAAASLCHVYGALDGAEDKPPSWWDFRGGVLAPVDFSHFTGSQQLWEGLVRGRSSPSRTRL